MARILVINDDPAIRSFVSDLLEYAGYEVNEAADGAEGLQVIDGSAPDAIVLDLMMPPRTTPSRSGSSIKRATRSRPALTPSRWSWCHTFSMRYTPKFSRWTRAISTFNWSSRWLRRDVFRRTHGHSHPLRSTDCAASAVSDKTRPST
jgi:CheY-like chemotaxis protein